MVAPRRAGCKVVALLGLVSIMERTKVEHMFTVEAYFSHGRSIIATQHTGCGSITSFFQNLIKPVV